MVFFFFVFFFFKQKTEYDFRISDGSSDVCSSDLQEGRVVGGRRIDRTLVATGFLVELVEDLESGRVGTDRRRGREALEVVGTQRVDQGIGLHAVTADELLEEAVLQRLAQDGHAGAVPIVDEHQRIGTPASELGELDRKSTRLNSSH